MLRVLELFCGIGGLAAALDGRARVVAAVDVNTKALDVYSENFPHPTRAGTIESLRASDFRRWDADLWWLSPPCQPFTGRGLRRDAEDPRARPFLALLERLAEARPRYVALENVPGFLGSNVHALLRQTLDRAGYAAVRERLICPSALGVPNRRERYYLVASRERLAPPVPCPEAVERRPLREFLDAETDPALDVEAGLLRSYEGALDLVDARDPSALTSCFTSAYGRSFVRSGSYLVTDAGARRFSPQEVLRLLGFPPSFVLGEMPLRAAWRLIGNSLSLAPVRTVLAEIPELTLSTDA